MEIYYSSLFIYKSAELKLVDTCLKIQSNHSVFQVNFLLPKIQFLISFLDSKSISFQNIRALVGFSAQVFWATIKRHTKYFGLKNSVDIFQFWQLNYTSIFKYFWLYCPEEISSKFISLGIKGKKFRYLRLLVLDIFNFFGSEFYQQFYINYFDFPGIFVIDIFFQINSFFSKYISSSKQIYLSCFRNFLTFFKCLLVF